MGDLPMMETWPQIFVDDADEDYALSVLNRAQTAPPGIPWTCRECGEISEPQFTQCWNCGADRATGETV
jgi:rubrerythrin